MKRSIKSTILIVLTLIALISVSLLACACNNSANKDKTEFTASEAFSAIGVQAYKENANRTWDVDLKEFLPNELDIGTVMQRVWYLQMHYEPSSDVIGRDIRAIQFDIVADRDVEGYFKAEHYSGGSTGYVLAKEKQEFSLKANQKVTVVINLDNSFAPNKKGELHVTFESTFREESDAWKAWTQTQYSISNFKLIKSK